MDEEMKRFALAAVDRLDALLERGADASHAEIKAAVELLFKVEVLSVQTANREGKQKRTGKFNGRRNHTKRAFVCLKPGQEINFSEEAA